MVGNAWKWLEMADITGHGLTYSNIAGYCFQKITSWIWLKMAGNKWKWVDMVENGWTLQEITRNGWKWLKCLAMPRNCLK